MLPHYNQMLSTASHLMDIPEHLMSAEQGRALSRLAILIENYEDKHHPVPQAPAHEMVAFLLSEKGAQPSDLWPVLGSKGRVSDLLSGKRPISKIQGQKLAAYFGVSIDLLLR